MAAAKEFIAALQRLHATNEPQTVGTFTFTRIVNVAGTGGFHSSQGIERTDWLTRESVGIVPREGGVRYWPGPYALKTLAKRLAIEDAAEMASRADIAKATGEAA